MPWETDCALCDAPSKHVLCRGCDSDLPRMTLACMRCGLPATDRICGACSIDPPLWDLCIAPFLFAYPLDRIMHAYKYHGDLYWAGFFAANIAGRVRALSHPLPQALVPVPITAERIAARGFNQARELARGIGAELDLPVLRGGLSRLHTGLSQVGLGVGARHANVRNAFALDDETCMPQSVAIVDDLVTTGATAEAIARQILNQGARHIQVWAAARTPPRAGQAFRCRGFPPTGRVVL